MLGNSARVDARINACALRLGLATQPSARVCWARCIRRTHMKRIVIGALACALALSASVDAAHAAPKKKAAAKKAPAAQEAPQSAEIGKAMGDLKWGMERETV